MKTYLFLALLAHTSVSIAGVEFINPVAIRGEGFINWSKEFAAHVDEERKAGRYDEEAGILQCRDVEELPGTVLCMTSSSKKVRVAFKRASIFAEGIASETKVVPKGQVILHDSEESQLGENIGGTDIKGTDLLAFHEAVTFACATVEEKQKEEVCLKPAEESAFKTAVLPVSKRGQPFVVISTPYHSDRIAGHELLHAQYMGNSDYRKAVDDFWQSLTEAEIASIKKSLSKYYDVSDDYLTKNEFQAFVLEPQVRNLLPELIEEYRDRLMGHLRKLDLEPIQITPFKGERPKSF